MLKLRAELYCSQYIYCVTCKFGLSFAVMMFSVCFDFHNQFFIFNYKCTYSLKQNNISYKFHNQNNLLCLTKNIQSLRLRIEVSDLRTDQRVQRNNFPGMHPDLHIIIIFRCLNSLIYL